MNKQIFNLDKEIEEEKKAFGKKKLNKSVLNIIRTTLRNNIELTGIADNKANVLLSLNALMLTFLVPLMLPHLDMIKQYYLVYPLMLLVITSLITIYMSAMVLKPGKFFEGQSDLKKGRYVSPFFFGNFYKMNQKEFTDYVQDAVSNNNLVKRHVIEDLHYIGTRLGIKMSMIRKAFKIFMFGFSTSIVLALTLIFIHSSS
ncbi:MAG: Pycsar system effector family protein [Saprospiraceae bacterium]